MSHLTLLANNIPCRLDAEQEITIELKNPLFNETEIRSLPFTLPVEGNAHLLGNINDVNSDKKITDVESAQMLVLADGTPVFSGNLVTADDEEIVGEVPVSVDSARQSFRDLISDMKCRDVPVKDEIVIGEKIHDVKVDLTYNVTVNVERNDGTLKETRNGLHTKVAFSPQALGFSYPAKCMEDASHYAYFENVKTYDDGTQRNIPEIEKSYINVDIPYPNAPYCNARVCYGHHDISEEDGKTADALVQDDPGTSEENHGPIWVLPADRPQSGICFYVLYFLDCLFHHLGFSWDKSEIMKIEDIKRLCFYTTHCKFTAETLYEDCYKEDHPIQSMEDKNAFNLVNIWLTSRGCGGRFILERPRAKSIEEFTAWDGYWTIPAPGWHVFQRTEKKTYKAGDNCKSISAEAEITNMSYKASVAKMIANSDNFPEMGVVDVIDSLERQFGIRFDVDYERRHVRAYFIKSVMRDQNTRPLLGEIFSFSRVAEKITGVKIGYAAESDDKEQRDNVRYEVKNFDTDYDYIDYDKNRVDTSKTYKDILREVNKNENVTLYVDLTTGNRYRVKIDEDFTSNEDKNPRLFDVGAYHHAEFGDCSAINEDYVEEMRSNFQPVPMIDVNYRRAAEVMSFDGTAELVDGDGGEPTEGAQGMEIVTVNEKNAFSVFVPYCDEDMEHEFLEQRIRNTFPSALGDFYVTEVLQLQESYDPSQTDDGNSPLQSYDWGGSIAIMRGGGNNSGLDIYDGNYDYFANSKWRTVVGNYSLACDSIDPYGNPYDYNGQDTPGLGAEQLSLRPLAYVTPEWSVDEKGNPKPLIGDNVPDSIKYRGYVDKLLREYVHFLLNRKKYIVRCVLTAAQINDIPNHWLEWWNINGRRCLINTVNAPISSKEGIKEVEMEVFTI